MEYRMPGGTYRWRPDKLPRHDFTQTFMFILSECKPVIYTALMDKEFLSGVLTHLADMIGMTPLESLSVLVEEESDPGASGVSVVLVIKESHLAVHTWPLEKGLQLEVSSCRGWDLGVVLDFIEVELPHGEITILEMKEIFPHVEK